MKILFCQTQFKMGGQQKVLLTVANELNKSHDVTIYYENYSFFDLSDFKTIRPKKHIQIINLGKALVSSLFKFNFKKKIVADDWHLKNIESTMKNKKFDIVILLNPYILFVEQIKYNLINTNKVICWTHNIFENYVDSCFKFEKDQLFKSMSMADKIVSLESYTASKWKTYNENTVIIHNPVTIQVSKKSSLDKKIICCTGRIQIDSKGLDLLCKVVQQLNNDIIVHYAGSGKPGEVRKFKQLIDEYGISEKIILQGPLQGDSLKEHYRSGSIFLMTSRYEGFPLVATEAMAFGLPFVGFNIPSLQEVTECGKYGRLFEEDEIEQMAAYINYIINSKESLTQQSNLSVERASHFKLDKIIDEWNNKVIN